MNLRQKFYWHVFIQWLQNNDLLVEYMEQWETIHPAWSRLGFEWAVRLSFPQLDASSETWESFDPEDKKLVSMAANIQRQCNKRDIGERFYPPREYNPIEKPGNRYHRNSWVHVCQGFARECVYGTRVQKVGLATIKRAWTNSGATLSRDD